MEHESDGNTNYKWCTRNDPIGLVKGQEELEIGGQRRDHPNNFLTKIGQNAEKSPGHLRRLVVN